MFHELAINCSNFSFSKKGRSNCDGRRISIRKGGEAMGPLAGSIDVYGYNGRNEVVSSRRILNGSEVRGFSEEFAYDPIGNRVTATGYDETGASYVSGSCAWRGPDRQLPSRGSEPA